jgi:hypothetical protein
VGQPRYPYSEWGWANVNITKGLTTAGAVLVVPGARHAIQLRSSTPVHLVVDLVGYVTPAAEFVGTVTDPEASAAVGVGWSSTGRDRIRRWSTTSVPPAPDLTAAS